MPIMGCSQEYNVLKNPQSSFLHAVDWMTDPLVNIAIWGRDEAQTWLPHQHDFFEIVIVLKGTIRHLIYDKAILASTGDVFMIPPSVEHGYAEPDDCSLLSVIFDEKLIPERFPELAVLPEYRAFSRLEPNMRRDKSYPGFLKLGPADLLVIDGLVKRLERELAARDSGYVTVVMNGLADLIVTICRIYSSCLHFGAEELVMVGRAMGFIEERFAANISLDDMVAIACMSRRTFLRRFRAATGFSPMAFLLETRLAQAKKRLVSGSQTVTEIAFDVGFQDSNHFARRFREAFGMSPSEFRKSC